MKIAIIVPSPVPYTPGGIETLASGLHKAINDYTNHSAELLKFPVREATLWQVLGSYATSYLLPVKHFDLVITIKYPSWMVRHPRQLVYMAHRLRGLYDTYHLSLAPGEGWFRFPGPLARTVVKLLDDWALNPQRIISYAAISATVAARPAYFPPGTNVNVVYPAPRLENYHCLAGEHFLSVGRLDGPKRVELIIQAMQQVQTTNDLLIVGDGPLRRRLELAATGDRRIRFLGQVPDSELVELYARALAVIYPPYQEDYGYITIEALKSGKPVITCTDSGGVLEFIKHRENGLIVEPTPTALASAMEALARDPAQAQTLGEAGQQKVAPITWRNVIDKLLGPYSWPEAGDPESPSRRLWITILNTFAVNPPLSGGQARLYYMARQLAKHYDVTMVCFGTYGETMSCRRLAQGLLEVRVPPSYHHARRVWDLERRIGAAVFDVSMPKLWRKTPAFVQAAQYFTERSDLIIAAHPFLIDVIKRSERTKLLVYEAADHEYILKKPLLGKSFPGWRLLRQVYRCERKAVLEADVVIATSLHEGKGILDFYGVHDKQLLVVPNGVDTNLTRPADESDRQQARAALGLTKPCALFMGAWHPPNLEAFEFILQELAPACPEIQFLVLGSVKEEYEAYRGPLGSHPNVQVLGVVDHDTKLNYFQAADVALNPMTQGTGTNLKMFEYMAAGIPVLSTPFGARGIEAQPGKHYISAERDRFSIELKSLLNDQVKMSSLARAARQLVKDRYEWGSIITQLHVEIEALLSSRQAVTIDLADDQKLWGFWPIETWDLAGRQCAVRWSKPRATLILRNPRCPAILSLEMFTAIPGQTLQILVHDRVISEEALKHGWNGYRYELDAILGRDFLEVKLIASPFVPDDHFQSGDRRRLGLAFKDIKLEPQ